MQKMAIYACMRVLSEELIELALHIYQYANDGGKSWQLSTRETENQVKLHRIDPLSDFVNKLQHGILEFDPQLVRHLIEKITIC